MALWRDGHAPMRPRLVELDGVLVRVEYDDDEAVDRRGYPARMHNPSPGDQRRDADPRDKRAENASKPPRTEPRPTVRDDRERAVNDRRGTGERRS